LRHIVCSCSGEEKCNNLSIGALAPLLGVNAEKLLHLVEVEERMRERGGGSGGWGGVGSGEWLGEMG
jgi:hypothetical protein